MKRNLGGTQARRGVTDAGGFFTCWGLSFGGENVLRMLICVAQQVSSQNRSCTLGGWNAATKTAACWSKAQHSGTDAGGAHLTYLFGLAEICGF
jgi:hypothetical protein